MSLEVQVASEPLYAHMHSCHSLQDHSCVKLAGALAVAHSLSTGPYWMQALTRVREIGSHQCRVVACWDNSADRKNTELK
jgi:hypothetical protein